MKTLRTHKGMTLIELMIAMLVGVFIMAGILQIFVSAKQNYKLQENLSRLQENGRLAINLITQDIRMAGYIPYSCGDVTAAGTIPLPNAFDISDTTNNWCNTTTGRKCVTSVTTGNLANTRSNIRLDVLRSYQWSECPPAFVATTKNEISYFLRTEDSSSISTVPSLWRRYVDNTGAEKELQERVENIEAMMVLYGIDTDADSISNYYVDAASVTTANWANVVSVRIYLLAVTNDNGLTATPPQPYVFHGGTNGAAVTTTPADVCASNGVIVSALPCTGTAIQVNDLRLRREFSTTIAVRNRQP